MALIMTLLVNEVYAAEKLNPRTFCPINGSDEKIVLLIDTSDPLTSIAQERLKELLKGFGDSDNEHYLPQGHELIVYRLPPKIVDIKQPSLRICNPGNPNDRTFKDDVFASPVEAQRKWRIFKVQRFLALPKPDEQVAGKQSPLLESIAVIAARHIPSIGVGKRKPTRLFLFSDMLQNSDLLSHYKSLPMMKEFKSLVGYSEMDSDLTDVKVWLFYVRRTGSENVQTAKHYYWWTKAIDLFGGRLMEQVPL